METMNQYAGIAANTEVQVLWDSEINDFEGALALHARIREGVCLERLSLQRLSDFGLRYFIGKNPRTNISLTVCRSMSGKISYVAVVLYETEIVRYYPDGTFSVDGNGFPTPTTSSRITQFTPPGWFAYHKNHQLGLQKGTYGRDYWPINHTQRFICDD